MNDDFSQRLLERIEREQIKPIPRWFVVTRQGATWMLLALCLLSTFVLGSLVFLAGFQLDLEFLRASSLGPMLRLLLASVPLVWVFLLLLFCSLELFLLRRETHVYRYPAAIVAGMLVLGVVLGGLGLYAAHLPERIQTSFPHRLPPSVRPWFERGRPIPRPEDGVLFGRVREVQSDQVVLIDPPGHRWQVLFATEQRARWHFLHPGQHVLVHGRIQERGVFHAEQMRPYQGRPGLPSPFIQERDANNP